MDKALFGQVAEKHGWETPRTANIQSLEKARVLAEELKYPCILKPSFRTAKWNRKTPAKVFKVFSGEELLDIYEGVRLLADNFIVQEYIPGPDSEIFFCLMWYDAKGELGTAFAGRKLLQWYPETGSTCIAERCDNEALMKESKSIFDSVDYRGIGSIEFKRDARDGRFRIIEPTVGREDLQSVLAFHCGVNIPLNE
jgi:predicted ATP-grasp superfamily ATP-dependent carboligase